MNYELGTLRFRAITDDSGISALGTFNGSEVFGPDARIIKELWLQPYDLADSRTLWYGKDADKSGVQCSSDDGITGDGEPGGECAKCPLSRRGASGCRVQRFVECYASLVDPDSEDYDPMDTEAAIFMMSYAPPRPGAKPNTTEVTARVIKKMVEKHVNNINDEMPWVKVYGIQHSQGSVIYARMDIG